MDWSMFEPLRDSREPMGVSEAEAKRVGGNGPGVPSSGVAGTYPPVAPSPAPSAAPPTDLQAELFRLVTAMRKRQPKESDWIMDPDVARLRADVDHLTVIVEMLTETVLRSAEHANAVVATHDRIALIANGVQANSEVTPDAFVALCDALLATNHICAFCSERLDAIATEGNG